ncbi:MAG TPA: ATP-binding protein [Polyangiaceae bacterium]|nr:ATP-binding protein [Polyangiaceae bacterium]
MTGAIPFAGLAPDARLLRHGGDLANFDFQAAIRVGRAFSDVCTREVSDTEAATHLVELVNSFEHASVPACVLVRAFVARPLSELPSDARPRAQPLAGASEVTQPYLVLLASRGLEPAWNDVRQSNQDRALDLSEDRTTAELARLLQVAEPVPPPATVLYVPDATTSSAIADKRFVKAYGIRSVIGFSLTPWPGESVVVVAFLRVFIERAAASSFETVARYAKVSWLDTREARRRFAEPERERLRAAALAELLSSHESLLNDSFQAWRSQSEHERQVSQSHAHTLEGYNATLRRAQRAMLNVVEDLREARAGLAEKVEQRTRELANANAQLDMRNQELEEFVYIASHDLQEPLRTVSGYLQMIERRYAGRLSDEVDEFIRFSIDGAHRMQELIESLLTYSRIARREKALDYLPLDVALDEALENLAFLARETGASIERTPLPRVQADRIEMVQLFQNLLSNALKFSGKAPPRVRVSGELSNGECKIVVRDEGIGFNPKYVDRIFKVFRRLRRDTPGTGIGLAVCKKIAERHGGRIEAHSAPGEGATFVVRFPVEQPLTGDDA